MFVVFIVVSSICSVCSVLSAFQKTTKDYKAVAFYFYKRGQIVWLAIRKKVTKKEPLPPHPSPNNII